MLLELVIDECQHGRFNLISKNIISLCDVVILIKEEMTIRPSFSSSCSSYLLHIIFNTLGHVEMYHTLKVGEIQTHA